MVAPSDWVSSALVLALISMAMVSGLFFYFNRKLKRQYFTLWMFSWICYALYLMAAIGLQEIPDERLLLFARRACIGISGLFMFWGSFQLTFQPRTLRELRFAVALVLTYCFLATYAMRDSYWLTVLMFAILGSAGMYTGYIYLRRRVAHRGATVLGGGFVLWGSHLLLFPWLELSAQSMAVSYLVSAGLAVMIAIAMVVEQEVNVAEKSYRLLFDASSDAAFLVDMWNLNVLEANRAAERLTKYPVDALVGMAFPKLCPSLHRGTGNVLNNQQAFKAIFRPYEEFYLVQAGGERAVCEGEAVLAEWRQRLVFQVNVRDVGEHRKLAEQIHRAEKLSALGQLVAGVAHELNNPLAIVLGKAQLLLRQPQLDATLREEIACIQRQSERASRIVCDLLSYARPSEPNKAPLDLNRVIRDVLEWRRPACEAADILVRTGLAKSLPRTKADRIQIEQIVTNLINNAIDALREQPLPREIGVSTEETTSFLRICVSDNGPGMAPEIREKIFDPFFTTKPIGHGTGLGLTICNTYVQEHRGKIWTESVPGKGAVFFCDLPLVPCEGSSSEEPVSSATTWTASSECVGQKVLIIDDEPDIVHVLQAILAETGFQIQTASNGNEALQILSNENFDVILSDIRMPGMDGQTLYHRLRATKPALAERVIFVTGDTVSGKTREFLDETGNLWFGKPFRLSEVVQRVQEVLQRQQPVALPVVMPATAGSG